MLYYAGQIGPISMFTSCSYDFGAFMQNVLELRPMSSQGRTMHRHGSCATDSASQWAQESRANHQFVAMLGAYRCSGGLARAQEVLALFKRHCGSDLATLARWIVKGNVISFEWQSELWLPLFQFNRIDMTPQTGLAQVLAELNSVYDAWELADWFSQSNPWLADRTPAETLMLDATAVLHAARAERLIAVG
ncbi:hypothetical protein [Rhodoferax ferrireducens]|uniref:hypothetical protein n=1 Tax=Rhodoferax ferrireducens TaxID=192843 RepID=UPI0013006F57|nr:hypothetical protein [Rhodoferax ferrireducens]